MEDIDVTSSAPCTNTKTESSSYMEQEQFQRFMYELFDKNGVMSDLRSYLRKHIVEVLKSAQSGESPPCQKHFTQRLELISQAVNILIVEYLLRLDFGYSLSVFVSEIPLANMVFEYSRELQKTNCDRAKGLRFKDHDIWNILNYLGVKCDSEYASNVLDMYKSESHTPLILCIIKCMNSNSHSNFKLLDMENYSDGTISPNHTDHSNDSRGTARKRFIRKCHHFTMCEICQRNARKLTDKYKKKAKSCVTKQASINSLEGEMLMKKIMTVEKGVMAETMEQIRQVYETEMDMVRVEEEKKVKRSLAHNALELQQEKLILEETYRQRAEELEQNVAAKRRFLWGLAKTLRDQHRRLAKAMEAITSETRRISLKENALKKQIAEAEERLRQRGDDIRLQISHEIGALESHVDSLKREREHLQHERLELEEIKSIYTESSNKKSDRDDILSTRDLKYTLDIFKSEIKTLCKKDGASSKCTMEISTVAESDSLKSMALNNEPNEHVDRHREEVKPLTPYQVVNDFKKQKNVNFDLIKRNVILTPVLPSETHNLTPARSEVVQEIIEDRGYPEIAQESLVIALQEDDVPRITQKIHEVRNLSPARLNEMSEELSEDRGVQETALKCPVIDVREDVERCLPRIRHIHIKLGGVRVVEAGDGHGSRGHSPPAAPRPATPTACVTPAPPAAPATDAPRTPSPRRLSPNRIHVKINEIVRERVGGKLSTTASEAGDFGQAHSRTAGPVRAHSPQLESRSQIHQPSCENNSPETNIMILMAENERLKSKAKQQEQQIQSLAAQQARLAAALAGGAGGGVGGVGGAALPVAPPLPPDRPRTAPATFGVAEHPPTLNIVPIASSNALGWRSGAGEAVRFPGVPPPRVMAPGDVIPFIGVLRDRPDSRRVLHLRNLLQQWRATRRVPHSAPPRVGPPKHNTVPVTTPETSKPIPEGERDKPSVPSSRPSPSPARGNMSREKSPNTILREAKSKLKNRETAKSESGPHESSAVLREAKLRLRKLEIEAEAVEQSYREFRRRQEELKNEVVSKDITDQNSQNLQQPSSKPQEDKPLLNCGPDLESRYKTIDNLIKQIDMQSSHLNSEVNTKLEWAKMREEETKGDNPTEVTKIATEIKQDTSNKPLIANIFNEKLNSKNSDTKETEKEKPKMDSNKTIGPVVKCEYNRECREYNVQLDILGQTRFRNRNAVAGIVKPIPIVFSAQENSRQTTNENYIEIPLTEFRKMYHKDELPSKCNLEEVSGSKYPQQRSKSPKCVLEDRESKSPQRPESPRCKIDISGFISTQRPKSPKCDLEVSESKSPQRPKSPNCDLEVSESKSPQRPESPKCNLDNFGSITTQRPKSPRRDSKSPQRPESPRCTLQNILVSKSPQLVIPPKDMETPGSKFQQPRSTSDEISESKSMQPAKSPKCESEEIPETKLPQPNCIFDVTLGSKSSQRPKSPRCIFKDIPVPKSPQSPKTAKCALEDILVPKFPQPKEFFQDVPGSKDKQVAKSPLEISRPQSPQTRGISEEFNESKSPQPVPEFGVSVTIVPSYKESEKENVPEPQYDKHKDSEEVELSEKTRAQELKMLENNINKLYNLGPRKSPSGIPMSEDSQLTGTSEKTKQTSQDSKWLNSEVQSIESGQSINDVPPTEGQEISPHMFILISPKKTVLDPKPSDSRRRSVSPEQAARLTRNDVLDAIFHTGAGGLKRSSSVDVGQEDDGEDRETVSEGEQEIEEFNDDFSFDADNYRSDISTPTAHLRQSEEDDKFWSP